MKPRTIALITVAGTLGMLITVGVPLLFFTGLMHRPAQRFPAMVAARPPVEVFAVPQQAVAAVPVAREQIKDFRGAIPATKDLKVAAPAVHANLGIFLIQGPDRHQGRPFLALHEALAQGKAQVQDRGLQLAVRNMSDSDLFIQSGDIVKGGNQDRTIEYDQLIPPQSGPIMISANCVEQGRSRPRSAESAQDFVTTAEQLPTRSLRLANLRHSQGEVWSGVQRTQNNLARSVGSSVRDPLSVTSLQLTLENDRVLGEVQRYLDKLLPLTEGKKNVIGFAVVVNGKIQSADVYASANLFERLRHKLIRAAAIEALAERSGQARFELPTTQAVQAFLTESGTTAANRHDGNRLRVISLESSGNIIYDACDTNQQNMVVHRCVLAK
jgi:hypothetical protein